MTADHWLLALLLVVTLLYVAWSAGRLRAAMQQEGEAIRAALVPLQASAERITQMTEHVAQMVRELHNR